MSTLATRRTVLAGLAAAAAAIHPAFAQAPLGAADFGLRPGSPSDQTAALLAACAAAAAAGLPLLLPAGTYIVGRIDLPSRLVLRGVPGASVLQFAPAGGGLRLAGQHDVSLDGLVLDGSLVADGEDDLVAIADSTGIALSRCRLRGGPRHGVGIEAAEARIEGCDIAGPAAAAVFSRDGRDVRVVGNRISGCGDGGVLVWRSQSGRDGSIVADNTISAIDNRSGGNGQYGNGINVFRADEVIVSGNRIGEVQFSAIRLNATHDVQVSGNICTDCAEVAIFSEFAFSGSIIADNIVDRAAQGISITNFNEGGRLASCTGNIVRNIAPRSAVNPDTVPIGIAAEADAVVSGNVVEAVPGVGIAAGWGPYLRDVVVADNVVRETRIGIGVSVAEGAGRAVVASNLVSGAAAAGIAGLAWQEMVSADLVRDAAAFPNIALSGNSVS